MHYPHPIELAARRRKMALIGAGSALVAAVIIYLLWPAGPFYHGHSLDAWLQDCVNPFRHMNSIEDVRSGAFRERMENARKAVKAIGTNGIPHLLQLLQAKGATTKDSISIASQLAFRRFGSAWFPSAWEENTMVMAGFAILQKDAMPAEPTLIALTKDNDAGVRMRAFQALCSIEQTNYQKLVPLLVPFGHDPDPDNRQWAAVGMRIFLLSMTPEEAEKVGVYDAFPDLRHLNTNVKPQELNPDLFDPKNF
jgi:hypothetical protein